MVSRFWKGSAPLTATGVVMVVVLAGALVGLAVDPRVITGAPAWLKPAKFAASIAIYTFTLAWIFSLIPGWTRTRRIVGWTTAVTLVLEIALISLQAFRGTPSHFNVATTFDGAVFTAMGAAIVVQTLSTVAVAVALWRQPFVDRALGTSRCEKTGATDNRDQAKRGVRAALAAAQGQLGGARGHQSSGRAIARRKPRAKKLAQLRSI
jgi:hypothetical protein